MTPETATADATDDGWISAHAAGEMLGDSKVKVLNAVIGGTLIGKRIAGRVIVRLDSVLAEIERRKPSAGSTAPAHAAAV